MQEFLDNLTSNPKRLFLIDCFGAILTAFLLGVVLTSFEHVFGVPQKILYPLSFVACLFVIYSFLCYLYFAPNWRSYMRLIAYSNFLYCCFTMILVFVFKSSLSILGVFYFLGEALIILTIVWIELKTAARV